MVLQRQYFARQREERQQNARRAQVRRTIDSFRRQQRPPADSNNERTDRTRPPPFSTDFLLLANPSAMDSIANELRLPKRQRIEDPRRRRREHVERVRQEPVEEPEMEAPNDIRIFDAEGEKTQLFRKRTLPSDFLNSEARVDDRRRGRRNARDRSRDVAPDTGNWHHPDRSHHNAHMVRSRREPSIPWFRKQDQSVEVSRRVRQRREASPSPLQTDQNIRISGPVPRTVLTPDPSHRGVYLPSDRLTRGNSSKRNRSPKSSSFDNRAISSRFDPDEVVEATPSEDENGDVYKDFLLGLSPSLPNKEKSRIPTAQKLLSTLTAITPHFPPIRIDSDDSETRTQYRSKKLRNTYEFRSLLAMEDITSEQFSADLKGFECKMLNLPDQDVPFLSISKMAKDRRKPRHGLLRNASSGDSQFDQQEKLLKKTLTPTFTPNKSFVKSSEVLGVVQKPATIPTVGATVQDVDKNSLESKPNSKHGCPSGIEITVSSATRNPVTTAADGVASEITMKN